MLRRRLTAFALGALAASACGAGSGAGGRFVVERASKGSGRLLDDSASAIYCPAESLLTIVAVGRVWSGGLAMRVVLPARSLDTLHIQRTLGGFGTATAAFRPVGGVARFGVRGVVTLAPSRALDGIFEATVTDSTPPDAVFRGRFRGVAYRVSSGQACRL